MKLVHGGDIEGYKEKYKQDPVDFSANLSPLGLPACAKKAIVEALDNANRYPDPLCRELRQSIAHSEGVRAEQVVCGNGAMDVLYRLALAQKPKKALLTAPTFAGYEEALSTIGCEISIHLLKKESQFDLCEDILERISIDVDMVFICNPNNPTGRIVQRELLEKILRKCEKCNCLLVVDECFNSLLEDAAQSTMKPFLHSEHLFLLKAYTKQYAMAGVRLGYALSANESLLFQIQNTGQMWSVSYLAQRAGIALAKEKTYVTELGKCLKMWKNSLLEVLCKEHIHIIGSGANYVFFYTTIPNFFEKMAEQGVLVRDCRNYRGLSEGYYRAAVRDESDIRFFEKALQNIEPINRGTKQ